MGLTNSLFTSLSGLTNNSQALSVAGNNISNSNTTAYKSSRITFETAIQQTLRSASGPSGNFGGRNAAQVGQGARIGEITQDFGTGTIQATGINTDLSIDGTGFFVVEEGENTFFTRAGNFTLDRDFNLVSSAGGFVQGFGVDEAFNVVEGVTQNLNIPVGNMTIAEATSTVRIAGNLDASGDLATQGSISTSAALFSNAGATVPITGATALTSVFDAVGTALFTTGDIITVSEATKGGATIPDATFEVGPANTTDSDGFGTTMADYIAFLEDVLGIDTTLSGGVSISAGGEIVVESNLGTVNNIELQDGNTIVNAGTATPTLPFSFAQTQNADGESVRTSFVAFDSLGNEITIDLAFNIEARDNSGTTWRFIASSADDTDLDSVLGNGTLSFDTNGQLIGSDGTTIVIDRNGTGADNPQQVALSFTQPEGTISSLADVTSQVQTLSQDGSPIGTLVDFNVGQDGRITGVFSNSLLRDLGQVVLANFSNVQGLQEVGGNLYTVTPNSGAAQIVSAGSAGTGQIVGSTLELSNVDLAEEFINLINASTGFSANSRVLTTSDELLQELLASVR